MRDYFLLMIVLYLVKVSSEFNVNIGKTILKKIIQKPIEDSPDAKLLLMAPCPPPWDVSMLFSSSLCLDCDQRIFVLQKCLKEWNISFDCKDMLDCPECITCGLCAAYTDKEPDIDLDETLQESNKPNKDNEDQSIVVSVTLSLVGTALVLAIILVVVWYKRRRRRNLSENSQSEKVKNVKTEETLLKDGSEDFEQENQASSDKLLHPTTKNDSSTNGT